MIVWGVDPSSSITGLAAVRLLDRMQPRLLHKEAWHVEQRPKDQGEYDYVASQMHGCANAMYEMERTTGKPELLVVERVSVSWNVNTIRKIAYFEAVALMRANMMGVHVISVQATKARRHFFGKGNFSKEKCYELMCSRFPEWGFAPENRGGMDEADACVLALAGPSLLQEENG